jgi:hypothetical protein
MDSGFSKFGIGRACFEEFNLQPRQKIFATLSGDRFLLPKER